ncbi:DUF397 domain-containing protein [Kutzneria sp. CA-103260]|uniref:DUF397 domain-containing protein n=1 Tax=Kutzneria sp. CA-103260 TaxID=2802641 RepID=UPI001BAE1912|nr:hypothetical protein JJ691_21410 [Kutzneria sp. CA-103260]
MDSYDPTAIGDAFPSDAWETAAFCGPNGGNCVEVNLGAHGLVGLRDSKLSAGPVLVFDDEEWGAFVAAAKCGQFDRA